jgi:hypothetical protein
VSPHLILLEWDNDCASDPIVSLECVEPTRCEKVSGADECYHQHWFEAVGAEELRLTGSTIVFADLSVSEHGGSVGTIKDRPRQ